MDETAPYRGISSATRIPYALDTDWPVGREDSDHRIKIDR